MRFTNRIFALVGGFALTLAAAFHANAFPIAYSFSATPTAGPLDGVTENGTFTYDSSSIVPGGGNSSTGLLTALNLTWNGIAYNQTTANTGFLVFDPGGDLVYATFGNNCVAGTCTVNSGNEEWYINAEPGVTGSLSYSTPSSDDFFGGTVTTALSAVPEPSAFTLLGVGIVGLMFIGAAQRPRPKGFPSRRFGYRSAINIL
jgi:hypothetical protein